MEIRTEALETCPLCGSKDSEMLFTNTDRLHGIPGIFVLNKCANCSVYFLSPRPALNDLPRYYPDNYLPHQAIEVVSDSKLKNNVRDIIRNTILYENYHLNTYTDKSRLKSPLLSKLFSYLLFPVWKYARYGLPMVSFPKYIEGGRVLDIGCGNGNYLRILREFGWDTFGIEPSETAAESGKKQFGLNIVTGTVLDHKFPDNYFHVISMNHVLEHLHNPVQVLTEIKRIVRTDGTIAIRTPNMDSFGYKIFGKNWLHIDTPRHLMLYSKDSFSWLCKKVGLDIQYFDTAPGSNVLASSLEYARRDKKGLQDTGIRNTYLLSQNVYSAILNLIEKVFIALGSPAGDELQVVIKKTGDL